MSTPPDETRHDASGLLPETTAADTASIANVDHLPQGVTTYPLHPIDPAKIGDFWPSARLVATASGVAYLAYEDNGTAPVMVILLSQGASEDPAARDRFAGQVDRMDIDTVIARGGLEQDTGRLGSKFRSEADDPQGVDAVTQSPWVALGFDQSSRAIDEAARVLSEVDLSWLPQQGSPAGPDYRLHWSDRVSPGLTRVWPLPWPGRKDRGGRLSILASWLLMLLLAAIAILIAILIFSKAPETPPPPPIPQTATETSPPQSGSPSPQSESPSQSPSESSSASPSQSPSPSESSSGGSPTPSPSASETASASPTPSPTSTSSGGTGGETETAPIGSPTPPSRL